MSELQKHKQDLEPKLNEESFIKKYKLDEVFVILCGSFLIPFLGSLGFNLGKIGEKIIQ